MTSDMIVFAKGASAGCYPLAGVIISDKIYRFLRDGKKGIFAPGHTHSGTPMAGAVGVVVHEYTLQLHKQHVRLSIMICYYEQYRKHTVIPWISPHVNAEDEIFFAMLFTLRESRKLQILRC